MGEADDVMVRISEAMERGQRGDPAGARALFLGVWADVGEHGDPLHRCALAHAMADVQDDAEAELTWDLRALAAADQLTDERVAAAGVAGSARSFYPSLHLNLADVYGRLGEQAHARAHVSFGREVIGALAEDGYRQMIVDALDRIEAQLDARWGRAPSAFRPGHQAARATVPPMRAVRCTEDGVAVVDLPEPEGEGVVVEVASVGICGTDLHMLDMGPRPITFGHEIGGTVDGRAVSICPLRYCGECASCLLGQTNLCRVGSNTVVGIHRDGGMADRLLIEAECLVELPEGATAADAWLVEPIAVGVHAFESVPLTPDMRVAIVGGGTVGLVAAAIALHRGCQVDVVARHPHQQAAAVRLGAGTEPRGKYDVVMDAAGTESAAREAVRLCRPGGWFVISGNYWGDVTLPGTALSLKELRVLPVIYYGHLDGVREADLAAQLLGQLPGLGEALVTHRFPLDRAPEAFATAADRSSGAIKVLVEP